MDYKNQTENFSSSLPSMSLDDCIAKFGHEYSLREASSSNATSFLQNQIPQQIFNINGSPFIPNALRDFNLINLSNFSSFVANTPSTSVHDFENYETKPFANHARGVFAPISDGGDLGNPMHFNAYSFMASQVVDASMVTSGPPVTTMDATMVTSGPLVATRVEGEGSRRRRNKIRWTIQEDRLLTTLVETHGIKKLTRIAISLNGKTRKQCRDRWYNHLIPNIKHGLFTKEEEKIMIKSHAKVGTKWLTMAKMLPGRTENSLRNHWNTIKRRTFSGRRHHKSKIHPRQHSILSDYMRSLTPEVLNASGRNKKKPPSSSHTNTNTNNLPLRITNGDERAQGSIVDNGTKESYAEMGAFLSL